MQRMLVHLPSFDVDIAPYVRVRLGDDIEASFAAATERSA